LGLSLARGAAVRASAFNGILARAAGEPHQIMVNEMVLQKSEPGESIRPKTSAISVLTS
jgi:hypothetical protein